VKLGPLDTKKIVVTDFETFFDDAYTLRGTKALRYEEYILDPRFKAHGVAVAYHNGRTDFIDGDDIPKWIRSYRTHTLVNHQMHFDGLIWRLRYNHVAPFMVDTKGLANQVFGPAEVSGGNDLESVAERMGFQPKGRVDMFKGRYDLTPEEYKALVAYATNDADITYKVFHALLPLLTRPEFELWLLDHTLRTYIDRPLPVLTRNVTQAIGKVVRRVRECVRELPRVTFNFTCHKPRTKDGVKYRQTVVEKKTVDESVLASNVQFGQALIQVLKKRKVEVPMKTGKGGPIPALAKADEGFMALKSSSDRVVRALVTARLTKRSGDTQIARLRTLLKCAKAGGFRPYLNYWGALSGRWSGGSGLNTHNFPNPTRSPDEFERLVASLIRACIVPPKGRAFVAVDAANIEARVLAWWAGQQDLVDAFGSGADVYSDFAGETFGEEVRKPKPDDTKDRAKRLKLLRNAGKVAVLGLGYSMGAPKFEKQQRANPDVRELFVTGELDTEKCEAIVRRYRTKYPKIPELWGRVEAAFFKALGGARRMVNGVLFSPGPQRSVLVTLPSGRVIRYPNVRIGEHDDPKKGKRVQWVYGHGKGKKLYGGLLVENIVQAISRDILAEGVWAMEQEGYPVAYHVHDSIVSIPPKKKAKAAMDFCVAVLSAAPEWGAGMKLGAEGAIEACFA
jgi:DNA polymerase